jgi:hypothetical protein
MPRKPTPKWDDPKESERFLEAAKAAEASDDPKDFERAVKAVSPKARGHSDNS